MNTIQKLMACLIVGIVVFGYGCNGKDDDPVGCNWAAETQDELNAFNDAAAAWGADPTNPTKCQAYKDAAQDWLDDMEAHADCATLAGTQAELQASIDSAQASINAIQC